METSEQAVQTVEISDTVVIKDFAEKIDQPVPQVIAHLMQNGIMLSMNERIDFETASIIADDFGISAKKVKNVDTEERNLAIDLEKLDTLLKKDTKDVSVSRPPVVVVMGHVDHGKTTLLDAIRKTEVAEGEAGGITQSIGAYQVVEKNRAITFIDTPGHEAFSAMRSRGANVADIAILVVAADDGLKPQTKEALEMIQRAELPFIVAINKIDKDGADVQRVKTELTEIGLTPEDWSGKTIVAEVSAKKVQGIHELLELVLLVADLHAEEIVANLNREAVGTIIESHVDKGAGPVATVLIRSGTLHIGELFTVGSVYGKVKAMKNFIGTDVDIATPSMPVRILGLKGSPVVGDVLQVTKDHQTIKQSVKEHSAVVARRAQAELHTAAPSRDTDDNEEQQGVQHLNIVLKTDTVGSQEAIAAAIQKIVHKEVQVSILTKGLGTVTDKDVDQADAGRALLLAFNVSATSDAREIARERAVEIKEFFIIYELLDYIKEHVEALLSPEVIEIDLGTINILQVFKRGTGEQIVGGKVTKGKAKNGGKIMVERKGTTVGQGNIVQLQAEKKNVDEVREGTECGIKYRGSGTIESGDDLRIVTQEKRARKFDE